MARPSSNDLRERVALFVLSGEPVRRAAAVFRVSVSSVVKWTQRHRETGTAAARPMGGRRHDVMAAGRDYALARLAEHLSLALRVLQAELAERGVVVSYGAVWHFVHAEGLSFKKPRWPASCTGPTSPADGKAILYLTYHAAIPRLEA
jgi:transposase